MVLLVVLDGCLVERLHIPSHSILTLVILFHSLVPFRSLVLSFISIACSAIDPSLWATPSSSCRAWLHQAIRLHSSFQMTSKIKNSSSLPPCLELLQCHALLAELSLTLCPPAPLQRGTASAVHRCFFGISVTTRSIFIFSLILSQH